MALGRQPNSKNTNKLIELLTLVSFYNFYMFRDEYGTIFKQCHQMGPLLLNCPYMDPC
jgi:hypothetical protein